MNVPADFAPLDDTSVSAIEHATVQAVSPAQLITLPGWLLPMDPGTIGRAHSAVPLAHNPITLSETAALLPDVAALYRAHGHRPVFRLPAQAAVLNAAAAALGAQSHEPTWVMHGTVDGLARVVDGAAPAGVVVRIDAQPSEGWQSLFLGEGFDPVDGACRVRNLSRAGCNRYVTAMLNGEPVACGAASLAQGWLGVHGMRTAASQRGRGWAGRVLQAMAGLARSEGLSRVFLQVGAANAPAQRLYERAGLQRAWDYAYWRMPG